MTVSALVTRNDITATASQTSFTYTFRVLEATDMDVYQNGALLASGYTVNDVGVTTGGTVTLDVGVPVGQIVSLVLAMPLDRTTNYQNSGDFLAGDVNGDFDKIYIGAIQNENEGGRSLRLQDVEPTIAMTLPLKAARLGKYLAFDASTGLPIATVGTGTTGDSALVTYEPAGTGAVATSVQAKLREIVSVMDFGAVGDGTTDDTAAIQAALDSLAITVYFPRGNYLINSQLVLSDVGVPLQLRGDGYLSSRIKCNFSGANILVTKANVEFSGLRFNAGDTAVEPIAVKSALTTNNADCDVWFRDCWFNTGIHIGHDVVGRGSQFLQCTLKCTTVMQITAPNPYVYSGSSPTQPPEGGMRRYKVVDCDIDGITTLVGAPNSTTADKYIHSLIISGNHFNGVDYLIRAQSCIDASIVNNTISSTKNGGSIEALIAVKYLRDVTITGNYFAGWPNSTIAATGRWNILISATNDPFDFTDVTVLNETLIENVIISGNVLKNLKLGIIKSYGNVKRATVIGNSLPEIFEYSNETNIYLINSRTYADIQIVNNSLTTDVANVTGTPTYYTSYGSVGGNGAELTYGNTSDVALIGNDESQLEILPQGLAITGGLLTVEKTNSSQLAINSTNSNGASFLIKEGGSTVSGIGHFNGIAGLQLSGDGTTEHVRVTSGGNMHAGTDNSYTLGLSLKRWSSVYGTQFHAGAGATFWTSAAGTPEGAVTADIGSMFTRTDGGAGTTLYVKESGAGNTGWVAK